MVSALFERNRSQPKSQRYSNLCLSCSYWSSLPSCQLPGASPMVVVLQIFHFGSLCASLARVSCFKVFRVSQRPIAAYYSQFEKMIAWRLFGPFFKGATGSEKVQDILPSASIASIGDYSQFEKMIAWRLFAFGLCLQGTRASQNVNHILFFASCVSISVRCKAVICKALLFGGGNFAEFPFWQRMCFFDPR